jgi:hypothetical protein
MSFTQSELNSAAIAQMRSLEAGPERRSLGGKAGDLS